MRGCFFWYNNRYREAERRFTNSQEPFTAHYNLKRHLSWAFRIDSNSFHQNCRILPKYPNFHQNIWEIQNSQFCFPFFSPFSYHIGLLYCLSGVDESQDCLQRIELGVHFHQISIPFSSICITAKTDATSSTSMSPVIFDPGNIQLLSGDRKGIFLPLEQIGSSFIRVFFTFLRLNCG